MRLRLEGMQGVICLSLRAARNRSESTGAPAQLRISTIDVGAAVIASRAILVWTCFAASWSPAHAAGDVMRGESAYAAACAGCHASAARIARGIEGRTSEQREAWLEALLSAHHPPDVAVRSDLIAFLLTK